MNEPSEEIEEEEHFVFEEVDELAEAIEERKEADRIEREAIAQQEKLTVEASEQAQKVWGKRVSVVAKELRLNQLLSEVVGQAMLTFVIKDEILSIDIADN